jgi:hypothetical protein
MDFLGWVLCVFRRVKNGDRERRMRCWAQPDLHSLDLHSHGLAVEDVIGEVREKKKKKRKKERKKERKKTSARTCVREKKKKKAWCFVLILRFCIFS